MRDVRLVLRQDSREREVATVDADRRLSFDARLLVPADAESGPAWSPRAPRKRLQGASWCSANDRGRGEPPPALSTGLRGRWTPQNFALRRFLGSRQETHTTPSGSGAERWPTSTASSKTTSMVS
jgi:hypothetical protein